MLAICSDLDETPDKDAYAEQMRFLNTHAPTGMGEGAGLEVGNTIYFDMPRGQFAYWNTDDAGREMVRTLIGSGHIDCLHSYGDLATTRDHAGRALDELARHDLSLKVWIDHAVAPTNFGADIMRGHGDEVDHAAYHADLTLAHGIHYVWRGRVTSIVGQDPAVSSRRLPSALCPRFSCSALLKEAGKQMLGRLGKAKYAFHAQNRICASAALRDGSPVTEFLRCNPHPRGLDFGDTGVGISEVMTSDFLDRLVERQGSCILYTHLGKRKDRQFDRAAVRAFHLLASYQESGKILVTTTRRLLDYRAVVGRLAFRDGLQGERADLDMQIVSDVLAEATTTPRELQGVTFYISNVAARNANSETARPSGWVKNPADHTGQESISMPWQRLEFPAL
jgi:hypothetical protein